MLDCILDSMMQGKGRHMLASVGLEGVVEMVGLEVGNNMLDCTVENTTLGKVRGMFAAVGRREVRELLWEEAAFVAGSGAGPLRNILVCKLGRRRASKELGIE